MTREEDGTASCNGCLFLFGEQRTPSQWVQDPPTIPVPNWGLGLTWRSFEFSSEVGAVDTLERTELGRTRPQGLPQGQNQGLTLYSLFPALRGREAPPSWAALTAPAPWWVLLL